MSGLTLLVALLFAARGAAAQEGGAAIEASVGAASGTAAQGSAPSGGLHRVAASIESALDVHRLALVEIVAATRKVREAGDAAEAAPSTPIPEPAREVFMRLGASVPRRIAADSLPAVTRAYHLDAVDALEGLQRAATLSEVAAPCRAYGAAVSRMVGQADEIIELFSRPRPIQTKVVDPNTALDEINDALDELGRAEAGVRHVQERKDVGEQLQAFLRLEIALGHALDTIAEAQEAGVHIGFEVQLATGNLEMVVKAVRRHVAELDRVLVEMGKAPRPLAGEVTATIEAASDEPPYESRLVWRAPEGAEQPAALRIYRDPNKAQAVAYLAAMQACDSGDPAAAATAANEQLSYLPPDPVMVAELAPGRGSYSDKIPGPVRLLSPPIYRVVPVSPFGVEGDGPKAAALFVPRAIEGAPIVTAHLKNQNPADPALYEEADLVEVTFTPSRNELPEVIAGASASEIDTWAKERNLAIARGYRVLRKHGDQIDTVGTLRPGTHAFTDRPSPEALAVGISYYVETITDYGRAAQDPKPCVTSEVHSDVPHNLTLARLGLAFVRHPTAIERDALAKLEAPAALAAAKAELTTLSTPEREQLTASWWHSLAVSERERLLETWPTLVSDADKQSWLLAAVDHVCERDRPWILVETWLLAQPPFIGREIDRWWELLDKRSRQQTFETWKAALSPELRQLVEERFAANDESVLRAAKVIAWWSSRDPAERERLEDWWATVTPEEKHRLYGEWLLDQPAPVQVAVRWPPLAALTPAERSALLDDAYEELPAGLLPRVLAFREWEKLDDAALAAAVATEVGAPRRLLTSAQYALRPLDSALGFHLPAVAITAAGVALAVLVAWRIRRRFKVRSA